MPKETKRFINPLLRPSSNIEVETRPESAPKQSEPEVALTKTTADTSTATSTEMSIPSVREAVPLPPTQAKTPPVYPEAQVIEPEPQTGRHVTYPPTETSTYQAEVEVQRKSQVNEPPAEMLQVPEVRKREDTTMHSRPAPTGYESDTVPGSEAEFRADRSPAFPSSATVVPSPVSNPISPLPTAPYSNERIPSPMPEVTTFASPLPQTSTYTYGEQKKPSLQPGYDEPVEQEYYTPPPVRRRRGAQSFEKTHERITVWVDKRLKQAFEELSYTEETSKTALLNEALADLLRKHSSR